MDKAKLTNQEAFNIVLETMRKQGMPAYEGGTCFMRTPGEGLKCALGALLTDDEARKVPNLRIGSMQPGEIPDSVMHLDITLLGEMQRAHDEEALDMDQPLSTWPERFEARMVRIANRFELVLP